MVVAAVLAAVADAVLVAHRLPKRDTHLVTAHSLEAVFMRGNKEAGGGDAAVAGDKQLGSCAAGKKKHTASFMQWQFNPRGHVPSASWYRWP
jgi:hypothetical protein